MNKYCFHLISNREFVVEREESLSELWNLVEYYISRKEPMPLSEDVEVLPRFIVAIYKTS